MHWFYSLKQGGGGRGGFENDCKTQPFSPTPLSSSQSISEPFICVLLYFTRLTRGWFCSIYTSRYIIHAFSVFQTGAHNLTDSTWRLCSVPVCECWGWGWSNLGWQPASILPLLLDFLTSIEYMYVCMFCNLYTTPELQILPESKYLFNFDLFILLRINAKIARRWKESKTFEKFDKRYLR